MIRRYGYTLVVAAALAAPPAFGAEAPSPACVSRSTASLDALVQGDFAGARRHFSSATGQVLGAARLKMVWNQLQDQVGVYQNHGVARAGMFDGYSVILTRVAFAKVPLEFMVACDAQDHITTFRFAPIKRVQAGERRQEVMPVKARVEANGVRVQPVVVNSPLGPLQGALTLPAGPGPFPGVVLVAGSGPNDRDETIGPNKPLRDIADGLAATGVASLRYDKRTLTYGARMMERGNVTVDDEVTDDALSAVHLLGQQKQIDARHLFVLGHSLGAMMAPRIGQRDPELAGLVLLAAPARPLLDLMLEQFRYLGSQRGLSTQQIASRVAPIVAERKLLEQADPGRPLQGSFSGVPQPYWMSFNAYDPVAVARSLAMPMLILEGGADYQVSPERDFARWKAALGRDRRVQFHEYPGLSHLFMPAGKPPSPADYTVPGHVSAQVIHDIAVWIKAQDQK